MISILGWLKTGIAETGNHRMDGIFQIEQYKIKHFIIDKEVGIRD